MPGKPNLLPAPLCLVGKGLSILLPLAAALLLAALGVGGVWATPGQSPLLQTAPAPESIVGTVFEDLNRDGTQNWAAGELGIPGVRITVRGDIGVTRVVSTNQLGDYQFVDLTGGQTYTITENDLAGYFSTTPNVVTATLPEPPAAGMIVNYGDRRLFRALLPIILRPGASW